MTIEFEAELWEYQGEAPWVLVTIPAELADEIRVARPARPFGSVKVTAQVGESRSATSLFPDAESVSYVLPIKREIREDQSLKTGDSARFTLQLEE